MVRDRCGTGVIGGALGWMDFFIFQLTIFCSPVRAPSSYFVSITLLSGFHAQGKVASLCPRDMARAWSSLLFFLRGFASSPVPGDRTLLFVLTLFQIHPNLFTK